MSASKLHIDNKVPSSASDRTKQKMTHHDRFHTQLVSLSHFLSYCFITDSIISDITLQVMKKFKKFLEHFVSFQTCDWIFIGERSIWLRNSVHQWSECEASIVQQDWNLKWETFIPTSTNSVQLLSSICSKVSIIVIQLSTTENITKIATQWPQTAPMHMTPN